MRWFGISGTPGLCRVWSSLSQDQDPTPHAHLHRYTLGAGRVLISVGCLADRTEVDKPHRSTLLSVAFPFYKMKSVLEMDGSDGCTAL